MGRHRNLLRREVKGGAKRESRVTGTLLSCSQFGKIHCWGAVRPSIVSCVVHNR